MKSKRNMWIIIVLVVVVVILGIRVVFDSKFDDFDNYIESRENYEGGTEKFDEDFQNLVDWEKAYREEHPDATDEEINQAFKDAWGK